MVFFHFEMYSLRIDKTTSLEYKQKNTTINNLFMIICILVLKGFSKKCLVYYTLNA